MAADGPTLKAPLQLRYASLRGFGKLAGLNYNAERTPTIMKTRETHASNPVFQLFLLLTLAGAPWAPAATNIALPFYEPFAYTNFGARLGVDSFNGGDTWGNTRANPNLASGNLSYPNLLASAGNKITVGGGTAFCDDNGPRPNFASGVNSGSLYISFLLRIKSTLGISALTADPADPGRCIVNLTSGGGTSRVLSIGLADDAGTIRIGVVKWPKNFGPASLSSFLTNALSTDNTTTYFVVAKYEIVAGLDNDVVTMWLNPASAYFGGVTEDPGHKTEINTGTDGSSVSMSRFYIQQGYDADLDELRIGRNWLDVVPSSCDAVSVLSPPAAVTNGVGGSATFTVTAAGTSPTYHWRRNGTNLVNGGNISGATSPTLRIDSLTASDGVPEANGYDVVVANTCGGGSSQTSARVALTLITRADLTWIGDGGVNEWNVETTLNWNNNTAAFTNFDNVTFDNSSTNTTVSVVGSPEPLRVLGNATNDYTLSGGIAGRAFVIKTNLGKLTLGGPNAYTGKTAIRQGTLAIAAENGLGGNPPFFQPNQLTLDGGTLQTTVSLTIDDGNRGINLGTSGGKIEVDALTTLTMRSIISGTGGGGLVKIGDGTLRMESFNTYDGNTTVSNGVMFLNNSSGIPFGNGAGTFILAGGTLTVESRGDPTLDILNAVLVSVDSELTTVQTDKSTVDFRLHNNASCLSGNGKLTIRDDSGFPSHLFHVRLYGSNLAFNGEVVLDPGAGGGTVQLSCNNQGGTHTFNGEITGMGMLMRRADSAPGGDTILNGLNTYSNGTFLLQGGIGFGTSSVGSPNSATAGPIGTGALIQNNSGSGALTKVFASGGARNVGNPIFLATSGKPRFVIGGADDLTLSGDITLNGATTFQVDNTGTSILSGNVGNGSLVKEGNGKLLLNGAITADDVTVNAGTLGGTGALSGILTVNAGGTLAPGASIGTFTVNNDVTLSGNTLIEVNRTAGTRDFLTGVNNLTYGGTLTVTNLSGTLTTNDTFSIFSATTRVGNFSSIAGSPGPGLNWSFNPASGVVGVVVGVVTNPTNISYTFTGVVLHLTWPASHFGWLVASNSVAVNNPSFWFDVAGSGAATSLDVTLDPVKTNVFFRLHGP